MNAFEQLRQQLRQAVLARSTDRVRPKRGRPWRRTVILALAGLVIATGVGAAAALVARDERQTPKRVAQLVVQAVTDTRTVTPCRLVRAGYRLQVVPGDAPSALAARYSFLRRRPEPATGVPSGILGKPLSSPTELLSRTVHRLSSSDGTLWWSFVARVKRGSTALEVRDPAGCLAVQRARLEVLARGASPDTVAQAERALVLSAKRRVPTGRGKTMVYAFAQTTANGRTTYVGPFSSSEPYDVRLALRRGQRFVYIAGLVSDRAHRVLMIARNAADKRRTSSAPVQDNVYSLALPAGTVSLTLTQQSRSGQRFGTRGLSVAGFGG